MRQMRQFKLNMMLYKNAVYDYRDYILFNNKYNEATDFRLEIEILLKHIIKSHIYGKT